MVIIYKFYFHYLRDQKNLNFGNNNFIRRQSFALKSKSVTNERVIIENYFSHLFYFFYSNLKTTKDNVILEIDNLSDEENEINKINKKVITYTNKTLFNKLVKKLRIVIAIINVLKTHQNKRPKLLFRQKTSIIDWRYFISFVSNFQLVIYKKQDKEFQNEEVNELPNLILEDSTKEIRIFNWV